VRELERLDRDLVPERPQVRSVVAGRPNAPERPREHRLPRLVEERDPDVATVEIAVADGVEPVPELGAARDTALDDDVPVLDAAGQLSRCRCLVAAFAILDRLDFRGRELDLAEPADTRRLRARPGS
jgi:hypothetical protein